MSFVLLRSPDLDLGHVTGALAAENVTVEDLVSPRALAVKGRPTTLVLDPPSRAQFGIDVLSRFVDEGGAVVVLGAEGENDLPDGIPQELVAAFVSAPWSARKLLIALRSGYREAAARQEGVRARQEAASRTKELGELTRIGMALTTERDHDTLLELILTQARQITSSDAGSLYLVETHDDGLKRLRFKLAHTYSRPDIPLVEFTMPLDTTSIAGYVATTGEPLVIDDVYFLPPDVDYAFNRSIDEKYGYRTKSMLTIPMIDHQDEVIGVLQLINRKRDTNAQLDQPADFDAQIIPYTKRLVELVSALAGQAAVSIENARLYADIERLFEGFVRASVTAIEQRDPTTFGHSGRVASMTVGLAEVVDRSGAGEYRNVSFTRDQIREIRYAGLLHDFGKVGVREQVLVKAKKLYPPDLALIKQRYAFVRRTRERDHYVRRTEFLEQQGKMGYEKFVHELETEFGRELEELDRFMQLILESNEPTVLPEGSFDELMKYAQTFYQDLEGKEQPLLTDDEVRFLSIRRGSLDENERLEIESHVTHTYRFLMQIPWTKELRFIPNIAYGHHEKLDGSGYPRKITAPEIPIQTRMMTISDIFDALTASDRPYKRAVPVERALNIMASEVEGGMLDSALFRVFTEAKVFERKDDDS
ncbi:MAG: HD domain-containing phosphohydrolase [Gemmatimonadales bacterium]